MKNALVITGASRGIGRATAQLFLNENWKVVNLSRRKCEIPGVVNYSLDLKNLTKDKDWFPFMQKEIANMDRICIVHAASTHGATSLQNLDAQELRDAVEVNLVAPVEINQKLLTFMGKGSSILYLGSTLSEKAVAGCASYVITKHAVVGMMRSTCQDLAGTGIHTVCVCPGFTDTEMLQAHLRNDPAIIEAVKARVGEHRLIEPVEIARTLLFCAENPVLNGSVIHANLGQIEQ